MSNSPTAADKGIKVGDWVAYTTPAGKFRRFVVAEIYLDNGKERVKGYWRDAKDGTEYSCAPYSYKVEKTS